MTFRQKTHSTSFHQPQPQPHNHLFNPYKPEVKPPLHTKSLANEDYFDEKSRFSKDPIFHHKKMNSFSNEFENKKKNEKLQTAQFDFLNQKTQKILDDLNRIKGKQKEKTNILTCQDEYKTDYFGKKLIKEAIEEKYKKKKPGKEFNREELKLYEKKPIMEIRNPIKDNYYKEMNFEENFKKINTKNPRKDSNDESLSFDETKENRSFNSNSNKGKKQHCLQKEKESFDNVNKKEGWNKNKKDIEILSHLHEKDIEILELRNNMTKNEIENKGYEASLRKYKKELARLQQENELNIKEIDYLKKFKNKLEDDIKSANNKEKSSSSDQIISEKNKEILDLKEKLLVNNAEHRISLSSEKDRLETEIKARDAIIREKNKVLTDLQDYKAQNSPYFEAYQSLLIKLKDQEKHEILLLEEIQEYKRKLEAKKEERLLTDTLVKEFRLFFMQTKLKLIEIGDMGSQIFEISHQVLSGEEINIDLLVGLIKPPLKSKGKGSLETPINSNGSYREQIKGTMEEIVGLKEVVKEIHERFKKDINEIYEVYVKKCGENCNLQ